MRVNGFYWSGIIFIWFQSPMPLHPYETENFLKKKITTNLIYQCKLSPKLFFGMLYQFIQSKKLIKIYVLVYHN